MTLNIIAGVLLACLALLILAAIAAVIWKACGASPRLFLERRQFGSREKNLALADLLIENSEYLQAASRLRSCFIFDAVARDQDLIEKVSNLHQSILGRYLAIADKFNCRTNNIAVLEGLLSSRCEMVRGRYEANQSLLSLRARHAKKVPAWAIEEYRSKIRELDDKLKTNLKSLNSQLDLLVESFTEPPEKESVTYH